MAVAAVLALTGTAISVPLVATPARAQEAEPVVPEAAFPSNMAFAPDGRLFYTELLTGDVRVVGTDGRLVDAPFTSFDVYTGASETGLLGIAIPPDFEQDPWVYVYLSDADDVRNRIVAVRAAGDIGGERRPVLDLLSARNGYHNGGDLLFAPNGRLFVAVGEAHEPARAQVPTDPGGKVLRIDPERPALDGLPDGAVFTSGHRNSFGLCRDPDTGDIWQTENGPGVDDEVNLLIEGGNYGWPDATGRTSEGRYVDPVAVFGEPIALTGCAVWRGELYVGAYLTDAVYRIGRTRGDVSQVATLPGGVTDLLVGPDDRLYVATEAGIYALEAPSGGSPIPEPERRAGVIPPWVIVVVVVGVIAAAIAAWLGPRGREGAGGRSGVPEPPDGRG